MYDFNVFQWDTPWNVLDRRSMLPGMIIRLDSCACNSYTKLQQVSTGICGATKRARGFIQFGGSFWRDKTYMSMYSKF